jgi:hypothetical protein
MANISYIYKVKQVATTATEAQVTNALNDATNKGFEFVGLFTLGSGTTAKFFAVFRKVAQAIV